MPRVALAAADLPLGQRLLDGLRYPLTGGALATCLTLALCRYAAFLAGYLPGIIGLIASIVVSILIWVATWRYAIDCMVRTADGYAEPPEVSLEDRVGSPHALLLVHIALILACALVALLAHRYLWYVLAIAAMLLPAIDMSLAFDGSLAVALNPATWIRTIGRFGGAYLIPAAANLALALLVLVALTGTSRLPAFLRLPLYGFACSYLVLLDFHWMGLLLWHYRERFGMRPEAPAITRALGQDADDELVRECEAQARTRPEEAAIRLRDRLRERSAPAPVHALFRTLLHTLQRNDLLLQHGRSWIPQLCAHGEARRALGVAHECSEIDPAFVPDDPDHAAMLGELAERIGMHRLAVRLSRAFAQRWPQHEAAARLARLAADEPPRP